MVRLKESSVTKELFSKYIEIQREGKYNMLTDAKQVMQLLGCGTTTYADILNNYENYSKLYKKTVDNVATNIQVKVGNLLTSKTEVIGHQTNCKGITGGLAGVVFKQHPECYEPYLQCCKVDNPLGKTQLLKMNDGRVLANIFGQNEAGAATDYKMVLSALRDLKKQMDSLNLKSLSHSLMEWEPE